MTYHATRSAARFGLMPSASPLRLAPMFVAPAPPPPPPPAPRPVAAPRLVAPVSYLPLPTGPTMSPIINKIIMPPAAPPPGIVYVPPTPAPVIPPRVFLPGPSANGGSGGSVVTGGTDGGTGAAPPGMLGPPDTSAPSGMDPGTALVIGAAIVGLALMLGRSR